MTHQESLTKVIEEIREEYPGMLILENEPFSKHGSMRLDPGFFLRTISPN